MSLDGKKVYGALSKQIEAVDQKLDDAIVGIYSPGGSVAFASLPELTADVLGMVYEVTDDFTTDSRFKEGAGRSYPAGTNVAVINTGTNASPVYKFDATTGAIVVDDALSTTSKNPVQNKVVKDALDGKVDVVEGKGLSSNDYTDGDVEKLSGIEAGAQVNVKPDWDAASGADGEILNKPTLGTAAALDVPTSGNASTTEVVKGDDTRLSDARTPVSHTHTLSEITDAGAAAAKGSTNAVTSGSTDLVESGAVANAIANLVGKSETAGLLKNDGTVDTNQYLTQHQDISGKADKAVPAATGNLASLDANGNLADSGKATTNAVTQNSTALVESGAVYTAINTAIGNAVDNLLATSY